MDRSSNRGERDSRFEILRIAAMFGIIIMHCFNGEMGGVSNYAIFPNFMWFFTHFCLGFCAPLVNCFVLITGYFMIRNNQFSVRKSVDLIVITSFYGIVMFGIAILLGLTQFSVPDMLCALFPFLFGKRWFVETYIILILIAPFLNKVLREISVQAYKILLCVQLMIFSVWYSLGMSAPLLDDGYGIINFITLYMLGAYIALYGCSSTFINKLSKIKCFILFVSMSCLTFALSYFINPYGYAFVTVIAASVFLFIGVYKSKPFSNAKINAISRYAFDVYFVHSDANTSQYLFNNILKSGLVSNSIMIVPYLILIVPCIYLVGSGIGWCRTKLFDITYVKLIGKSQLINKRINV